MEIFDSWTLCVLILCYFSCSLYPSDEQIVFIMEKRPNENASTTTHTIALVDYLKQIASPKNSDPKIDHHSDLTQSGT